MITVGFLWDDNSQSFHDVPTPTENVARFIISALPQIGILFPLFQHMIVECVKLGWIIIISQSAVSSCMSITKIYGNQALQQTKTSCIIGQLVMNY